MFKAPTAEVADCCAAVESLTLPCGVYLTLVNDEHMRQINKIHRGIDESTDVLSFPTVNYPQGVTASGAAELIKQEYSDDEKVYILGEIFISYEHVRSQAELYRHSTSRELCFLLAHGIYHCFGYDHEQPNTQTRMRNMEEKALELAGIPRDEMPLCEPTDEELVALAKEAMYKSYSPYSRFKVGACVLSEGGRVFTGTNIENASYGLTICAERSAIFKAVGEGVKDFKAIAITAENAPPWPCGACRQVLNEFAPDIRVLIAWGKDQTDEAKLSALLPHGFGPNDLP
ncbi:MAG: cytidine deaminase [Clostridiales bacterium]|nr:cytidine deaminase [Clostridiales bacterium]